MRRRPLIIANWKMQLPDPAQELKLARAAVRGAKKYAGIDLVIAPSFLSLVPIKQSLKSQIVLAAQDCAGGVKGAETGEVSPVALEKSGCKYVIVGHSERRARYGDNADLIAQKLNTIFSFCPKLIPILCIGESAQERSGGRTESVINQQLEVLRQKFSPRQELVIAYEPVWAIGSGATPTPAECTTVYIQIRAWLTKNTAPFKKISILYGGSVDMKNAASFLDEDGADGLLIGGASLKTTDLLGIVKAVSVK